MDLNVNIEQMFPDTSQNYGNLVFVIGIVFAAIYFLFYCLQSFGVMKIAQRHNVKHSLLAWVHQLPMLTYTVKLHLIIPSKQLCYLF